MKRSAIQRKTQLARSNMRRTQKASDRSTEYVRVRRRRQGLKVKPVISRSARRKLVAKADKVFADFIKIRDQYTCQQTGSTYQPTCGHVLSRRIFATRWDEKNAFCQSWEANKAHVFNPHPYFAFYVKRLGIEEFSALRERFTQGRFIPDAEIMDLVEMYESRIKVLKSHALREERAA